MAEKEYIEREAVISCILELNHNLAGVIQHINEHVPAADVVEVKDGAWQITEHPLLHDKIIKCPFCEYEDRKGPAWNITWGYHNFCPDCGAKMNGERKGQK